MHNLRSLLVGEEGMDLNRPPIQVPQMRSTMSFQVVVRRKVACRDTLVGKYGEEGYNAIISSEEPLILSGFLRGEVLAIFVLV